MTSLVQLPTMEKGPFSSSSSSSSSTLDDDHDDNKCLRMPSQSLDPTAQEVTDDDDDEDWSSDQDASSSSSSSGQDTGVPVVVTRKVRSLSQHEKYQDDGIHKTTTLLQELEHIDDNNNAEHDDDDELGIILQLDAEEGLLGPQFMSNKSLDLDSSMLQHGDAFFSKDGDDDDNDNVSDSDSIISSSILLLPSMSHCSYPQTPHYTPECDNFLTRGHPQELELELQLKLKLKSKSKTPLRKFHSKTVKSKSKAAKSRATKSKSKVKHQQQDRVLPSQTQQQQQQQQLQAQQQQLRAQQQHQQLQQQSWQRLARRMVKSQSTRHSLFVPTPKLQQYHRAIHVQHVLAQMDHSSLQLCRHIDHISY